MTQPNIMVSGEIDTLAGSLTNNVVPGNLTVNGNLVVLGTSPVTSTVTFASGPSIKGDFSNTTASLRTAVQSMTTNGNTFLEVLPNGTSNVASVTIENSSAPANNAYLAVTINSTQSLIGTSTRGSATAIPLVFGVGTSTNVAAHITIDITGNVQVGNAAIATTATSGYFYIPSCAGVPTGVPVSKTGLVPMVIDSTDSKIYYYIGGVWKSALLS